MSHETHAIRLTAAWERSGSGQWQRSFGRPSGLSPDHRVFLIVAGATEVPTLLLNGTPLGAANDGDAGRHVWDVTGRLTHRNTLEWLRESRDGEPPASGRTALPPACGEVAVEILEPPSVNNA